MNRPRKTHIRPTMPVLAAFVLALTMTAAGCDKSGDRPVPGTLRFNIATEPSSLDWSITTEHSSIRVLQNIMEGLTRFDDDLEVAPALAESWEVVDSGHTYIFHLADARWTDGKPVTAHDFVYSWRRLLDPSTAAEYAYFLYMVKNATAINSGEEKNLSALGVRAEDDRTLVVELDRPVVFFPMIVTFISTFPMREDVVDKHGDKWTEPENIVTLGPYRLASWHHEYKIELSRNEWYHGRRAGLDRVIFYMVMEESTALSLYQTGDLDVLDPMPPPAIPSYRDDPEYHNYPYFAAYYYGFNVTKPPVDNPLVRAALAHAVDRSQIPEILKGNQIPNPSVIPVGMKFANPELGRSYDPVRARALLKEAGYGDGRDLPTITIGYNTQEGHKMVAEFVQQQWMENLGIRVEVRNMEWKVYLKELQHDPPHVFRLGWILDYPDPDALLTVFTSTSGNNHTRWKNPEYDDLVARAALETDPLARKQLYDRAQKLLCYDDAAIVPFYTYTINSLRKPWVRDFPENGLDLLHLRDTSIGEDSP